jgi:hypothetical protein
MKDLDRDFFKGRSGTMRSRALCKMIDDGKGDLVMDILAGVYGIGEMRVNTPNIRKYHARNLRCIAQKPVKSGVLSILQKARLV